MKAASLKAPAKINLGLQVGPLRPDGFHAIRTVFQTVDLCDRLTVRESSRNGDKLSVVGRYSDSVPNGRENLVLRAINKFRKEWDELPALEVELEKNIPSGAGLGGGSSDAAAMLRVVQTWYGNDTNESRIKRIAENIGSDVLFFLHGGTSYAGGRGTDLKTLPPLSAYVVLVVPPYSVSTEWAYSKVDPRLEFKPSALKLSEDGEDRWKSMDLKNDFDPVLEQEHTLHTKIRHELQSYTNQVGLSGSGSTVYGLFGHRGHCVEAKEELAEQFENCSLHVAEFLSRHDLPQLERVSPCQSR